MKKIQLFFVILSMWLISTQLSAQAEYVQLMLDSLDKLSNPPQKAQLHNDIGYYLGSFDSLQADYHTRQALTLANKLQLEKEKANAYKNFGVIYEHHNAPKLAISHYDTAFQIFQTLADTSGMLATLNNSGRRHCYLGDCEVGIKKYQLAESWLKPEESTKYLIISINHGICLLECRAYEECLRLSEKAIKIARKKEDLYSQFHFHRLMGNAYSYTERYEEGLAAFTEAEGFATAMGNQEAIAAMLNDKGNCYYEMGFYENAYTNFVKSISVSEANGITEHDHRVFLNLGEVSKKLGKYDESILFFEKGLAGTTQNEDLVILADSYEMAAEAYNLVGKDQKAYTYMVKAKTLRDTVFTNKMRQNLQEITTRYETEKIKQELAASNLKIEQEQNRNRLLLIGGFSLFLLSGIGYLFFRGRQRRQALEAEKRKIELEYGLLRAQMNPHFIFNSLNSIQGYFASNQFVQGNEFLGKFSRLVRRVLDQSVAPAILLSEELETLKLYLDVEKIRLKDHLFYKIDVAENVEIDLIKVPPLVLQPFAENAIWHGIAPKNSPGTIELYLRMSADDQFLEIQLIDDGVGLLKSKLSKSNNSHKSKGIQITKERLGKTGQVSIKNKPVEEGTGVKVALKIPIIDHD